MTTKTPNIRHFYSKVAGISRKNDDGSSRQKFARECAVGEELALVHDPTNEHDPNAIRVLTAKQHQLGFIPADTAEELIRKVKNGWTIRAYVATVTGGTKSKSNVGINLLIVQSPAEVKPRALHRHASNVLKADGRLSKNAIGCFGWFLIGILGFIALGILGLVNN